MPSVQNPEYLENTLPKEALTALQRQTGIHGELLHLDVSSRHRSDATIELRSLDGARHQYMAECKAVIDRKTAIAQVRAQLAEHPQRGLLITTYLSAEMAEHCRAADLEFIDTAGNAYLNAPGMYVFIKGQKGADGRAITGSARGSGNATAQRTIFALLAKPGLLNAPYREIAKTANAALGAIGGVFQDLAKRGLLTAPDKTQARKLLEPDRLLDEWVLNYPVLLRPKLGPRRFAAADPTWWRKVNPAELHAQWGSEVAAAQLTNYLKPATQTLYVDPTAIKHTLHKLVIAYRLRPDPLGPIEILETFWRPSLETGVQDAVPPVLIYADLMATLDPRNMETAKMIRKKEIEHALHKT